MMEDKHINMIQLPMQENSFSFSIDTCAGDHFYANTTTIQECVDNFYSAGCHKISYQQTHHHHDRSILLERLQTMKSVERNHYKCRDYLTFPVSAENIDKNFPHLTHGHDRKPVDIACREKIVHWMYTVVDYFNLNRVVCFYALDYLDRFMAVHTVNRNTYKLVAMTTLMMAIKIHQPRKISLTDLISELSRGQFDWDDVFQMEMTVLSSLSWKIHPPSTMEFVVKILELNPFTNKPIQEFDLMSVLNLAKYFVELSSYDYFFVKEHSSMIALSGILNAMQSLGLLRPLQYGTQDGRGMSIAKYVNDIFDALGVDRNGVAIATCCDKLWGVYYRSQEYHEHQKRKLAKEQLHRDERRRNIFASIKRTTAPMKKRNTTGVSTSPNGVA